jgi:hypothetical protein
VATGLRQEDGIELVNKHPMNNTFNENMIRKENVSNYADPTPFMDLLRQQTLLDYMRGNEKAAEFTYTSGGIRLAAGKDSVISDWSPQELESAVNALVKADKLYVTRERNTGKGGEAHIKANFTGRPNDDRVNLPLSPPARLVSIEGEFSYDFTWNTNDDTIPAEMIYELIMTDSCVVAWALGKLYESRKTPGSVLGFDDSDAVLAKIAEKLSHQGGDKFLSEEELAICREPVEGGIPRLGKYRRQIRPFMDDGDWTELVFCDKESREELFGVGDLSELA